MKNFRVRNRVFGTYPSVFHHPGIIGGSGPNNIYGIVQLKKMFFDLIGDPSNGSFWDRKEKIRLNIPEVSSDQVSSTSNVITIIFVTNLKELGSAARSCDFFGIPYRILGQEISVWSNTLKLKLLRDEIPKIKTKYIMLLDSDDVFLIDNISHIVNTFELYFECDMLLNAAQNFWPKNWLKYEENEHEIYQFMNQIGNQIGSRHKYMNSGAFIAKTIFLKEMLKELNIEEGPVPDDDQSLYILLYKKYYPRMQLDYNCRIFQCEFDEELVVESPLLPWYKRQILHSRSLIYPLLVKHAEFRRKRKIDE